MSCNGYGNYIRYRINSQISINFGDRIVGTLCALVQLIGERVLTCTFVQLTASNIVSCSIASYKCSRRYGHFVVG